MKLIEGAFQDLALKHVAIIMDGNGRWARSRGLSRLAGHARGAEALLGVKFPGPTRQMR